MFVSAPSDFGSLIAMQRTTRSVQTSLETASAELATGRTSDINAALGASASTYLSLEVGLQRLETDMKLIEIAASSAEQAQQVLSQISERFAGFDVRFANARTGLDPSGRSAVQRDALKILDDVVQSLNRRLGDRVLFAGSNTNSAALADPAQIPADIVAIAAAAASPAAAVVDIDAYFDDIGGGFDNTIWLGADQTGDGRLSSGQTIDNLPQANAPEIRKLLKGLAMVAATADPAIATDAPLFSALEQDAEATLFEATEGLVGLRESVGISEGRLEMLRTSVSVEISTTRMLVNEMVSVDQFETATRIQALEVKLQTVFALSARQSALSLTSYL